MKIPKLIKDPYADSKVKDGSHLEKVDGGKGGGDKLALLEGRKLEKIDSPAQKPLELIVRDESSVNLDKTLSEAGVENKEELKTALKDYGVSATSENISLAAEHMNALPEWAKDNMELIAILVARKMPSSAFESVLGFLDGKFKFAKLFEGLNKAELGAIRENWNNGQMLDALLEILKEGGAGRASGVAKAASLFENLFSDLALQELASSMPDPLLEGQIFFRWPFFWDGQELPDTLEGEAFVPHKDNAQQGFSLRMMVTPTNLGQMEVRLNSLKGELWVNFGVEEKSLELIRTLDGSIKKQVLALGDYDLVHVNANVRQPTRNFFVVETEAGKKIAKNTSIDFKV